MQKIYNFLRKTAKNVGYNIEVQKYNGDGFPPYVDQEFIDLLRKYRDMTMVPWGGLFMARSAARYVAKNKIEGAIVECGVWRGGCSLLMAETIDAVSALPYEFYLYDTFAGLPEPGDEDTSVLGDARTFYNKAPRKGEATDWCFAPLEEVNANIEAAGFSLDRFKLIKGKVEDTIPQVMPDRIALLRIDTDWYESTRHELKHLFPRLVSGGVLICDDYGFWDGARKAVDEYMEEIGNSVLLTVDTGTGRAIAVKR